MHLASDLSAINDDSSGAVFMFKIYRHGLINNLSCGPNIYLTKFVIKMRLTVDNET